METNDAFTQGVESPADDPFAGTDFGDFEAGTGEDPFSEGEHTAEQPVAEQPVEGIPVVDAEGKIVEPVVAPNDATQVVVKGEVEPEFEIVDPPLAPVGQGAEDPEAAAKLKAWEAEQAAKGVTAPEPAAGAEPTAVAPAQTAAALAGADAPIEETIAEAAARHAAEQPVVASAEPLTAESVQAAIETIGGEPDPTVAPAAGEQTAPSAESPPTSAEVPADPTPAAPAATDRPSAASSTEEPASPENAATEGEAPVPAQIKDEKTGVVTHRRYGIFTPTGVGTWKEVSWREDKQGKMLAKGSSGGRKQTVCVARTQEEALAVGYAAMGSPPDGVPLVAVALTYWQLKNVAPDPTPPSRVKLKIG